MSLNVKAGDRTAVARYEQFYADFSRSRGPALESFALVGSSILVAVASAPVGILASGGELRSVDWQNAVFWSASALGLLVSTCTEGLYFLQRRRVEGMKLQASAEPDAAAGAARTRAGAA
jgi:hypothetical protein